MKITKIKKGLVLITIASGALAVGCELIVDFDRTKIPVDVNEASVPDSAPPSVNPGNEAGGATDAEATPDASDAATNG